MADYMFVQAWPKYEGVMAASHQLNLTKVLMNASDDADRVLAHAESEFGPGKLYHLVAESENLMTDTRGRTVVRLDEPEPVVPTPQREGAAGKYDGLDR